MNVCKAVPAIKSKLLAIISVHGFNVTVPSSWLYHGDPRLGLHEWLQSCANIPTLLLRNIYRKAYGLDDQVNIERNTMKTNRGTHESRNTIALPFPGKSLLSFHNTAAVAFL